MPDDRLDESQAGNKIARSSINNLGYADDTSISNLGYGRKPRGTKSLLMKVKEESEKAGSRLSFQKTKILVSGPITSWQLDGESVEKVTNFISLGFKITVDGDCSHEIKRHLLLARKTAKHTAYEKAETSLC